MMKVRVLSPLHIDGTTWQPDSTIELPDKTAEYLAGKGIIEITGKAAKTAKKDISTNEVNNE